MSFITEIPELKPLPTADEFAHAHKFFDRRLGIDGARADVASRQGEIQQDSRLADVYMRAFVFGQFLEMPELEVEHGTRGALQSMVTAQAFAEGYMQHLEPQRLLYPASFTSEKAITMLEIRYRAKMKELEGGELAENEESWRFARSKYIAGLGSYGLRFIGAAATEFVDKWSRETYVTDTRQQMAFRLGHGTMAVCGRQYMIAKNVHLKDQQDLSEHLYREIRAFLDSDTSENQ